MKKILLKLNQALKCNDTDIHFTKGEVIALRKIVNDPVKAIREHQKYISKIFGPHEKCPKCKRQLKSDDTLIITPNTGEVHCMACEGVKEVKHE